MKTLVLAVAIPVMCSLSFAGSLDGADAKPQPGTNTAAHQQKIVAAKALPHSPLDTSDCLFVFTSGTGNTSLTFCITLNGNIAELQTPVGHSLVSSDRAEGYGVCDRTTEGNLVSYSDYGGFGDSGNWGPASASPKGTSSARLTRITNDGIWTLTETITKVAATSSVKILMTLKNNTAEPKVAFLLRYMDVDADGVVSNNFDGTTNSAFAWNSVSTTNPFGLLLQNTASLGDIASVGFAQTVFAPPDPCNAFANAESGPLLAADGSLVLFYAMRIPKAGSKSVTMLYKGL